MRSRCNRFVVLYLYLSDFWWRTSLPKRRPFSALLYTPRQQFSKRVKLLGRNPKLKKASALAGLWRTGQFRINDEINGLFFSPFNHFNKILLVVPWTSENKPRGLYIFFKGPFWGAYFWRSLCSEGLICGGKFPFQSRLGIYLEVNLRLKIDWANL